MRGKGDSVQDLGGDLFKGLKSGRDLYHFFYHSMGHTAHTDSAAYRRGWVTECSFLKRNDTRETLACKITYPLPQGDHPGSHKVQDPEQ